MLLFLTCDLLDASKATSSPTETFNSFVNTFFKFLQYSNEYYKEDPNTRKLIYSQMVFYPSNSNSSYNNFSDAKIELTKLINDKNADLYNYLKTEFENQESSLTKSLSNSLRQSIAKKYEDLFRDFIKGYLENPTNLEDLAINSKDLDFFENDKKTFEDTEINFDDIRKIIPSFSFLDKYKVLFFEEINSSERDKIQNWRITSWIFKKDKNRWIVNEELKNKFSKDKIKNILIENNSNNDDNFDKAISDDFDQAIIFLKQNISKKTNQTIDDKDKLFTAFTSTLKGNEKDKLFIAFAKTLQQKGGHLPVWKIRQLIFNSIELALKDKQLSDLFEIYNRESLDSTKTHSQFAKIDSFNDDEFEVGFKLYTFYKSYNSQDSADPASRKKSWFKKY